MKFWEVFGPTGPFGVNICFVITQAIPQHTVLTGEMTERLLVIAGNPLPCRGPS